MKLFGIRIVIHRSFWLLPLFLSLWTAKDYGFDPALRMFVLVMLVFVCVLGHELTHSLVALRLGIPVPRITLYPMGGVASMQEIPREPGREFLISIVGPFSNFLCAGLMYFPLIHAFGRQTLLLPSLDSWPGVLSNLFWANLVLGAFNLVPAFPMDGGRIFRSALSKFIKRRAATGIAVFLGRLFAILFFLIGLWKHTWMLAMVGVYVFFSASDEMKRIKREQAA